MPAAEISVCRFFKVCKQDKNQSQESKKEKFQKETSGSGDAKRQESRGH